MQYIMITLPLETLVDDIGLILDGLEECHREETGQAFHDHLQKAIVRLASNYSCSGRSEYFIRNVRSDGKNGSIDVAWMNESGKLIAVFELDSSWRGKSIVKLIASGAPCKIWVYYGKPWRESKAAEYDMNQITVIHRYMG